MIFEPDNTNLIAPLSTLNRGSMQGSVPRATVQANQHFEGEVATYTGVKSLGSGSTAHHVGRKKRGFYQQRSFEDGFG
jgi:hypothetical protein